jgi:hypothetical protein
MKIKVKVIPKARREAVLKEDNFFKVYLKEPPTDGKANKRLIKIIANYFEVKKCNVEIIKGKTCREKLVEIK